VAEGVEDAPTLSALQNLGCDVAQGYYVAKPMPADEFVAWIEKAMPLADGHVGLPVVDDRNTHV